MTAGMLPFFAAYLIHIHVWRKQLIFVGGEKGKREEKAKHNGLFSDLNLHTVLVLTSLLNMAGVGSQQVISPTYIREKQSISHSPTEHKQKNSLLLHSLESANNLNHRLT